jgi:hypothetical protein
MSLIFFNIAIYFCVTPPLSGVGNGPYSSIDINPWLPWSTPQVGGVAGSGRPGQATKQGQWASGGSGGGGYAPAAGSERATGAEAWVDSMAGNLGAENYESYTKKGTKKKKKFLRKIGAATPHPPPPPSKCRLAPNFSIF